MMVVSKFKNAVPRWPKREDIISEIPIKQVDITHGDAISANSEFIYFSLGSSEVGVLPVKSHGHQQSRVFKFSAGVDALTSLTTSPLDTSLVATVSNVECPKIWKYNLSSSISMCARLDDAANSKIKSVAFHPSTSEIVSYTSNKGLHVSSLVNGSEKLHTYLQQGLMSHSWKSDGSLMVTGEENGKLHVLDPRTKTISHTVENKAKNPKVIWAGMKDIVMQFAARSNVSGRTAYAWDLRNMSTVWSNLDLDSSRAIMYPAFDPQTGIIIVASKGENSFYFMELSENGFSNLREDRSDEASYGISLIPRQCLKVMSCEVLYLLQLNKSTISPVSYSVPRKSYSSFHSDLFPPAYSLCSSFKGSSWFSGENYELPKESLEPKESNTTKGSDVQNKDAESLQSLAMAESSSANCSSNALNTSLFILNPDNYSKFRHINSTKLHPSLSHDTVLNIETKTCAESDGVCCYKDTLAIPLVGGSGKIAILKLSKPGRVLETGVFFVENGSTVCDFEIDKKDDNILAVVCEDCSIRIWKLPPEGLTANTTNQEARLTGHSERTTIIKFHPSASGVFATGSIDGSIRIWDICKTQSRITCNVNGKNQILSIAWNSLGSQLAAISVDKKINIFDPRSNCSPILIGNACNGVGASRVCWIDENLLFISGFNNQGNRCIFLKDIRNLTEMMFPQDLDLSPSVLIPTFDRDNKLMYLSGKGDSSIVPYEVRNDAVGLFECPRYNSMDPHVAFCFLRKDVCDVANVEVSRCLRLFKSSTELVSFSVPRTRNNFFQDDLFPETKKVWVASMTADEWYNNANIEQPMLNLMPSGYTKLSEAKIEVSLEKKYDSKLELERSVKASSAITNDFVGNIVSKMEELEGKPIVQDAKQGVDAAEWED